MKKEDVLSIVAYLLMFAIALIVGLVVIRPMFSSVALPINPYAFVIIAILLAIIFNTVMLEVGHLIGGKIGGYNIVSFNVLYFCIHKEKNKWRFGFKSFDGLSGETVLAPKSEKANPKPYIWVPVFFFLFEIIAAILLYVFSTMNPSNEALVVFGLGSVIFLAIGAMIAVYNLFPARLDSMNDGYRLTLFNKPINVVAYNELMRIENLQREGKPIEEIRFFEEITDFTASLNLTYVYNLLGKKEYDDAMLLIDKICVNPSAISSHTYARLLAQKIYIKLMSCPLEEAKHFYENEVSEQIKRFISNDVSMESVRAYVLIAGLLEESKGEVQYVNSRKVKALKRTPEARVEVEQELYTEALNKVLEAHPDWDLSKN